MRSRITLLHSVRDKAIPTRIEEIIEVMKSDKVKGICDEIAHLKAEANESGANDKRLQEIDEKVSQLKRGLPAITPHACLFKDNIRKNEGAVANGLVMLDIDHVNPDLIWMRMKDYECDGLAGYKFFDKFFEEKKVYWVAKTPSGEGMRVIAEREVGESLADGQRRLADLFNVNEYDTCVKDLSRLSFLMPYDYIYYLDEKGFEMDDDYVYDDYVYEDCPPHTPPTQDEGMQNIYGEAIALWLEQNGGVPKRGKRNDTLFKLALDFRYVMDFDAAWLFRELPHFELGDAEVMSTIQSALKKERLMGTPKRLLAAIDKGFVSSSEEAEDVSKEAYLKSIINRQLPQLPDLPKSYQILMESIPQDFRAAAFIASLPALGTVGTALRFKYMDGQTHSPSFFSAVVGNSGSGKSFVRFPIELLLSPIYEEDALAREQENAYKEARQNAKNKEEQPNNPKVAIRIHPLNITVANLCKHMSYAGEKHLFSYGEEIDTMTKAEKTSWASKTDIIRSAYDNAKGGNSNASENSINFYQNIYYNLMVCGTPACTYRFFNNIEDGLVSRVCFAQLPNRFAEDIPVYKEYTGEDKAYVVEVMRKLMQRNGMHVDDTVYQTCTRWLKKTQNWARLTSSRAIDHYRKRACSMGFRAGMLFSVLEEIEHCEGMAAKIADWVADYCFTMLLKLFGQTYEHQQKVKYKEWNTMFSKPIIRSTQPQDMYTVLPEEFTQDDVIRYRIEAGKSTTKDSIRMILKRWKEAAKIVEISKGNYRKCA